MNKGKVGIVVQARMGSTRLPGKVLMQINNKPLLQRLVDRLKRAKAVDTIVLATSIDPLDNPIEELCSRLEIPCIRGSLDDVLDRYYQAATSAQLDTVVRITADCPLMDPSLIDQMVQHFQRGQHDYLANTAPPEGSSFPDGMDVEIFSMSALTRAWKEAQKPSEREHVTFYFWKNPTLFRTFRHDAANNLSSYRLTVDYLEDIEVVRAIFKHFGEERINFDMKEILEFLDTHPQIRKINSAVAPNLGWQSALKKDVALVEGKGSI